MTEGLGKAPFYTNNTWIKKWGFCFFNHNFVDVVADLMRDNKVKPDDVKEVVVHFDEIRRAIDRPEPKNAEDARFSIQHILAYQMIHGECGLEICAEKALHDPRIAEARKKVKVVYQWISPMGGRSIPSPWTRWWIFTASTARVSSRMPRLSGPKKSS